MVSMTPSPTWPPWQRHGKIGGVVEEVVGAVESCFEVLGPAMAAAPSLRASFDAWADAQAQHLAARLRPAFASSRTTDL